MRHDTASNYTYIPTPSISQEPLDDSHVDPLNLDSIVDRGIRDVSSTLDDICTIGAMNTRANEQHVVGGNSSLDIVFEIAPE